MQKVKSHACCVSCEIHTVVLTYDKLEDKKHDLIVIGYLQRMDYDYKLLVSILLPQNGAQDASQTQGTAIVALLGYSQ